MAIGISKKGAEFDSMDGNSTKIIVMLVSPFDGANPLMRAMAAFSGALMRQDVRNAMLEAQNPEEIIEILKGSKKA